MLPLIASALLKYWFVVTVKLAFNGHSLKKGYMTAYM